MKLENVFRRIHANACNIFHGRSPLPENFNDLSVAQTMPSGAVHPNNNTKVAPRSFRIADGASGRSATLCMVVSRAGGYATSLCQERRSLSTSRIVVMI